jgi:hypothetical protein
MEGIFLGIMIYSILTYTIYRVNFPNFCFIVHILCSVPCGTPSLRILDPPLSLLVLFTGLSCHVCRYTLLLLSISTISSRCITPNVELGVDSSIGTSSVSSSIYVHYQVATAWTGKEKFKEKYVEPTCICGMTRVPNNWDPAIKNSQSSRGGKNLQNFC